MVKVRWIGILILAYSVSNTLQQDSASDKDPKNDILRQFLRGSKQTNDQGLKSDSINDIMEYFSTLNKAKNKSELLNAISDSMSGQSYEDHDNKMPKRIKITYKRRSKISNKEKQPEKNEEDYQTSKDADLLPTMLDYLKRHKAGRFNSGDDLTVDDNSTYYSHQMAIITDKPEPLEKETGRERQDWDWNVVESDLQKERKAMPTPDKAKILINNIMGFLNLPDKPRSKEEVTHKKDTILIRNPKNGQHFSSVDLSNGNNVTTHELNPNQLNSVKEEKEVPKTAEKKESDASKQGSPESKLCESSKKNLSEFWKLTSRYFGLDNFNLTPKQKFDLFLTILEKVKQDAEETSPSKPETLLPKLLISKTPPTDNSKELHRSDPSESEITQDPILKLKKPSDPNNKVVGDLGSVEVLLTNKNKPVEIKDAPIEEMEISLNKPKNTSDEIDPSIREFFFDIIKPKETLVETPKVLQTNLEPKKETATSLDISDTSSSNSEEPFSDNIIKSDKINLNDLIKSVKYPQVDSILGSIEIPDNSNDPGVRELQNPLLKSDVDTEKKQDDHDFEIDPNITKFFFDIIKPKKSLVDTPKVLQTNLEPNKETATSFDIPDKSSSNSEEPLSDNVIKSDKINLNDLIKSVKYPQVDTVLGSIEIPDNSNAPGVRELQNPLLKSDVDTEKKQDDHDFDDGYKLSKTDEDSKKNTPTSKKKVNSFWKDTPSEISILSSEKIENDSDKHVLDNDYLSEENVNSDDDSADGSDTTIETMKNSSGDATKEPSGHLEKLSRLIESDIDEQALNKILISEHQGLENSEIPNNYKARNSRKLALLLQYLKSRPKDELLKILLFLKAKMKFHHKLSLKYKLTLKHLHAIYKNLSDTSSLDKSIDGKGSWMDGFKSLKQGFKGFLKYPGFVFPLKAKNTDANQVKNLADKTTLKETNTDKKSRHPFLNLKWDLRPRNDLTKVLLEIISKFRDHGISHEALRKIMEYLNRTLTEDKQDGTCQARKLKNKLNYLRKAFGSLLTLKKKAEANKKV